MTQNLPEWAMPVEENKTVYVKTAAQALSVVELIPEDWNVVVEDGNESRALIKLLRGMGLR